jgi:hypothetical protein
VTGLDHLLAGVGALAPAPPSGLALTRLELDLPLEVRIGDGAVLLASLPRGRLATGFDLPRGRIRARLEVSP